MVTLLPTAPPRRLTLLLVLTLLLPAPARPADPADAELARGMELLNEGDYGQAVIVLDATARRLDARGKRPDAARAYFHLGTAYVAENQERLAVSAFRKALERDDTMELSAFDVSPRVREMFERARREREQDRLSAKKGTGGSKALLVVGGLLAAGGGAAAALSGGGDGGGSGTGNDTPNPVCPGAGVTLTGSTTPVGSTVSTQDSTILTLSAVGPRRLANLQTLQVSLFDTTGADCYELAPVPVSGTACAAGTATVAVAFSQIATRCRLPFSIAGGRYLLDYTESGQPGQQRDSANFNITFNVAR